MKKKLIICTFILLFILPLPSEISYSQSSNTDNIQRPQIKIQEIKYEQPELEPKPDLDYLKVSDITGWDEEISKYFVAEAKMRGVKVFEEALPLISKETGGIYDFNLVNYNTNGTYDKGVFQINDVTYKDIVKLLKAEGKKFDSWHRLDPRFNISAGMCWLQFLKSKGLEGHSLFTSYHRGYFGAESYANRNGTYETRYSRDVNKIKIELIKYKNNS